ncbi:PucR family transcriptional regulator [Demetria terragena]|uniref:PucR family transcriptional regulator n=1 Tax=Demetria terragena TaxID=63959 RepID=UPI0012EA4A52|nr:helix-turn-helix domain-containing protein [Demetria terragena]
MNDEPDLTQWSAAFAQASLTEAEVNAFVETVDRQIMAAIPEIARDPLLSEELHASTRAHWRSFLVGLGDDYHLALPPAATGFSESIARRQLDINVLLKVYRVAHGGVFTYLTDRTDSDLPEGVTRDAALIHLWTRAARWMDDSVESLIESYAAERRRSQEGALARRVEAIQSLLDDIPPPDDVEQTLGHRLTPWQTAFVIWSDATADAAAPLSEIAPQICRRVGLPAPLTMLAGSREVWGWVATPTEPTEDFSSLAEFLEERTLRLAVGRPQRGIAGFRVSHHQAAAAQHLGVHGAAGRVLNYADIEMLTLLGMSDLAKEMVRRELGPLLGPSRQTVRTTVLSFLRHGRDVDATAAALFVHPNTVRYRIARAEEFLGAPVSSRGTVLEVCLAWVDLYGADALKEDTDRRPDLLRR